MQDRIHWKSLLNNDLDRPPCNPLAQINHYFCWIDSWGSKKTTLVTLILDLRLLCLVINPALQDDNVKLKETIWELHHKMVSPLDTKAIAIWEAKCQEIEHGVKIVLFYLKILFHKSNKFLLLLSDSICGSASAFCRCQYNTIVNWKNNPMYFVCLDHFHVYAFLTATSKCFAFIFFFLKTKQL